LLLAPIKAKAEDEDPLYRYVARVRQQRATEETKRLLYVAATRAKRALHLLGCARLDDHGDLARPDRRSLLAHLWPVVERDFQKAAAKFQPAQPQLFDIAAAADVPLLHRLALDWRLPQAPSPAYSQPALPRESSEEREITFEWVSDFRRLVGTVVHLFVQQIAREGPAAWSQARIAQLRPAVSATLRSHGITEADLAAAAEEVERALAKMLADERGRWCLASHDEAQSELGLSGIVDGALRHVRIDRTFVENGVRWIVDYKTGTREGGGMEAFLNNEVRRYREQLNTYGRLLREMDPRPARMGLYFPAIAGWREWDL
jgi:ATP-dependent exoDNAse (exonuclease V) beta subunit